ncbi:MAG TPA: hypothetical protein VM532_08190 [Burkholderiales bacterium]|nr:hypothetical protein [Burkholderiales bacterium]
MFESHALKAAIETINVHFISEGWSAPLFMGACDRATAVFLKLNHEIIPAMLALIERFPTLSKEELIEAAAKPCAPLTPKVRSAAGKIPKAADTAPKTSLVASNEQKTSSPETAIGHPKVSSVHPSFPDIDIASPTANSSITSLLDQIWLLAERLAQATQVNDLIRPAQTPCHSASMWKYSRPTNPISTLMTVSSDMPAGGCWQASPAN